jgi:hypothetical protein
VPPQVTHEIIFARGGALISAKLQNHIFTEKGIFTKIAFPCEKMISDAKLTKSFGYRKTTRIEPFTSGHF